MIKKCFLIDSIILFLFSFIVIVDMNFLRINTEFEFKANSLEFSIIKLNY